MSLFGGPSAGLGPSEADSVTNDFLKALAQPLLIQTPLQVGLTLLGARAVLARTRAFTLTRSFARL